MERSIPASARVVEGDEDLDRLHSRRADVGVGVDRAGEPEHVLLHIGGFPMHHLKDVASSAPCGIFISRISTEED